MNGRRVSSVVAPLMLQMIGGAKVEIVVLGPPASTNRSAADTRVIDFG
jgi:hypothetical protein